jgi:hypothetical protein
MAEEDRPNDHGKQVRMGRLAVTWGKVDTLEFKKISYVLGHDVSRKPRGGIARMKLSTYFEG